MGIVEEQQGADNAPQRLAEQQAEYDAWCNLGCKALLESFKGSKNRELDQFSRIIKLTYGIEQLATKSLEAVNGFGSANPDMAGFATLEITKDKQLRLTLETHRTRASAQTQLIEPFKADRTKPYKAEYKTLTESFEVIGLRPSGNQVILTAKNLEGLLTGFNDYMAKAHAARFASLPPVSLETLQVPADWMALAKEGTALAQNRR